MSDIREEIKEEIEELTEFFTAVHPKGATTVEQKFIEYSERIKLEFSDATQEKLDKVDLLRVEILSK